MSASIVLALRLISALILFAFLIFAFYSLYRDVLKQGFNLAHRRIPGISIQQRQGGAGVQLIKHFNQAEIIIGRDPASDIPLIDDTVSARHAQLAYHHGQWWVEDLASTNGTQINDVPILMPTVITSGDEIKCGNVSFGISLTESIILEPTERIRK